MKTTNIALSIDFDFFIREDPVWDWGHREHSVGFDAAVWFARYGSSVDVYAETDIGKYADFLPAYLPLKLMRRGLDLAPDTGRRIGIADSHAQAYRFFKNWGRTPPDVFVNVDAHHDCWTYQGGAPQCDNWLTLLRYEWPGTHFIQLYPRWKDGSDDGPPQLDATRLSRGDPHNIRTMSFEDWRGVSGYSIVRDIFVCRSSAWVPPHHDADFEAMTRQFASMGQPKILDFVAARTAPSREEANEMRAKWQALVDETRRHNEEALELSEKKEAAQGEAP